MTMPILYSFRRCPFAMRARFVMTWCQLSYSVREVDLKHKPKSLLSYSPKGTVPVLVCADGTVIDESLDIVAWALDAAPQSGLRPLPDERVRCRATVADMHAQFLPWVYRAKYPERHTSYALSDSLTAGRRWLFDFDALLQAHEVYDLEAMRYSDLAVFPFVRQWLHFDQSFDRDGQPALMAWFALLRNCAVFEAIMEKHPLHVDDGQA